MDPPLEGETGTRPVADSDPPPPRPATRAELDELADDVEGEIIEGRLYVMPKPRPRHVNIAGLIGMLVGPPFQLGVNGPGGWWILVATFAGEVRVRAEPFEGVELDLSARWRTK